MTLPPAGAQPGTAAEQERGIWLTGAHDRTDLATFAERALRLDDAAVIRLRTRSPSSLIAWVATGFDVLASRVVNGRVKPADLSAGADALARGLAAGVGAGYVDPGFAMDSAWHGVLPPESGFVHLDDVPVWVMLELAERGVELAREHGSAHGPPVSLLEQDVVEVSSGDLTVGVPMRCVFALTGMGFLPQSAQDVPEDEIVRVRASPTWLRIDARFGSVYRRRGDPSVVLR